MASSAGGAGGQQGVPVDSLNAQQLSALKKQLDTDLTTLTTSFQSLRLAQTKFRDCLKSLSTAFGASGSASKPTPIVVSRSTAKSKGPPPASSTAVQPGVGIGTRPILVPLTASLYVPGILASSISGSSQPTVIVDVGTGYYIEKPLPEARDFYERKIEEVGASLKGLEDVIQQKTGQVRVVEDVLRQKVLMAQAAGAQTAA